MIKLEEHYEQSGAYYLGSSSEGEDEPMHEAEAEVENEPRSEKQTLKRKREEEEDAGETSEEEGRVDQGVADPMEQEVAEEEVKRMEQAMREEDCERCGTSGHGKSRCVECRRRVCKEMCGAFYRTEGGAILYFCHDCAYMSTHQEQKACKKR